MKRRIRKIYFVEKGLQLRYVGIVLFIAFVTAIISGLTVFYTTWDILGNKLSAVYPQGLYVFITNRVIIALAKNMLLLSALIFVFAILVSHRIAGPIARLKGVIRDIGEGRLDTLPIYLRKTDELHDIAEELNKVGDKLKARFTST